MNDDSRHKQEAVRLELETCQLILRIITANARNEGLKGEEVEDCVGGFLTKKLHQGLGDNAWTEQQVEKLKRDAASYAKRYAIRLTRRCKRTVDLCGADGSVENGPAGQLVTKEPGPEELAIQAERLRRMLLPLPEMTLTQQQLFVRHYQEQMRLVDLQEETGRSAHALGEAVYVLRRRMRRLLEGIQMDAAEIADYQNMLDRFHAAD